MAAWTYRGASIGDMPAGVVGYVYLITCHATRQQYVGKKSVTSRTSKRKPGKTRRTWTVKESKWRDYWSSSDEVKAMVKQHGPDNFSREILHLCRSKREMSYLETAEQFQRDVLYATLPDGSRAYLNSNIAGRWFADREAA